MHGEQRIRNMRAFVQRASEKMHDSPVALRTVGTRILTIRQLGKAVDPDAECHGFNKRRNGVVYRYFDDVDGRHVKRSSLSWMFGKRNRRARYNFAPPRAKNGSSMTEVTHKTVNRQHLRIRKQQA